MGSSLSSYAVREYFVDTQLKQYVSEGTELVVVIGNDDAKDQIIIHVNVIRKDGKMVQLSSELTLDKNNWPRPSKELIAQLMMVG
jgi:hypothetical protein